jgi:hypothetical protein
MMAQSFLHPGKARTTQEIDCSTAPYCSLGRTLRIACYSRLFKDACHRVAQHNCRKTSQAVAGFRILLGDHLGHLQTSKNV